jgi:SAM-dependent MidA family methyltransferase
MMTVDYGYPRPFLYSPKRSQGTWQCFSEHQANQMPFERIGQQDITAHVDFTQIVEAGRLVGFEPSLFCSQGIFLSFAGTEHIEAYLKTLDPLEQKKRIGALQQLTHPDAMGEAFWVLVQSKETNLPEKLKAIPNRLKRLI